MPEIVSGGEGAIPVIVVGMARPIVMAQREDRSHELLTPFLRKEVSFQISASKFVIQRRHTTAQISRSLVPVLRPCYNLVILTSWR